MKKIIFKYAIPIMFETSDSYSKEKKPENPNKNKKGE